MNKREHSPLPWSVGKFGDGVNDANGYPSIDLWAEGDTSIKDAEFIVEACNNHERLKAENQRLRNALEDILGEAMFADKCDIQMVYELAEEALQQEGGDPCAK